MTSDYIKETLDMFDRLCENKSCYLHEGLKKTIKTQLIALLEAFEKSKDHTLMPKDLNIGLIAVRELEPRGHRRIANRLRTLNHYANTGEEKEDWKY